MLLRHAETAAPDRFHGAESDIGLGPRGFLQAEATARVLTREQPYEVVSSAMLRARQTAQIIAASCAVALKLEPQLHERKMGPLSGLSREDGLGSYDEAKKRWMAGELNYTHPGGESFAAIRQRVLPVFDRLAEEANGRTIVVVAHGVVIRVLLTSVLPGYGPEAFDRFRIDNTAINDLKYENGRWQAVALNSRAHLGAEADGIAW